MDSTKKLLLVDDEPEVLSLLELMFEGGPYRVLTARSGDEALAVLAQDNIDVLVSDIRMPGMDGIELMNRALMSYPHLQCIFMSGHGEVETAVQAMKDGALNFLLKPIDFNVLEVSVEQAVQKLDLLEELGEKNKKLIDYQEHLEELVQQRTTALEEANRKLNEEIALRKKMEEEARYQATHDSLTKLPNRLLFHDRLAMVLAQAQRRNEQFALLLLDLNGFKDINDTHGHAAGDQVLMKVGQRLQASLRESDMVARIGGDEFTVIIPEINEHQDITQIMAKIHDNLARPLNIEQRQRVITASIGVALYPDDGHHAEVLIKKADQNMYHQKVPPSQRCTANASQGLGNFCAPLFPRHSPWSLESPDACPLKPLLPK